MPKRFTLSSYRVALQRSFLKRVINGLKKPANDEAKVFRKEVRDGIKNTGLGRALWRRKRGTKKSGIRLSLKAISFKASTAGDAFIVGAKLGGVASMLVQGGQIEKHTIKPKAADVLAFTVGGAPAFATEVSHPGMSVSGNPNLVDRPLARFAARTAKATGRFIDGVARKTLGS